MRSDSAQKKFVIIAFAIVALGLAAFSIVKTVTANQGHAVGSLGDLSKDRPTTLNQGSISQPGAPAAGPGKEAEKGGADSASGAPAEASQPGAAGDGGVNK